MQDSQKQDSWEGLGLNVRPTDEEILTEISKYAKHWLGRFRMEGFAKVEFDEVYGELGIAYARALDRFNKLAQPRATFKTYLIKAFKNHMHDYRERHLIPERDVVSLEDLPASRESFCYQGVGHVSVFDLMRDFCGLELLVAKELIAPSEKIQKVLGAFLAKHNRSRDGRDSRMAYAIALVYGLSFYTVRRNLRAVKKKMEKGLISQ
jgi:hypothetical protein